jgi:hypothetical protein
MRQISNKAVRNQPQPEIGVLDLTEEENIQQLVTYTTKERRKSSTNAKSQRLVKVRQDMRRQACIAVEGKGLREGSYAKIYGWKRVPKAIVSSVKSKKGASQLSSGRFAATVGNLEARLEVTSRVHETPFVFPILFRSIVHDLPWLVECLEPIELVSRCARNQLTA